MVEKTASIDTQIVEHINALAQLVAQDVGEIETMESLEGYSMHVSVLESNLQMHAEKMLTFRERVVRRIASKGGRPGRDIYGPELRNIKTRRFFARVATYFTTSPPPEFP